MDNYNPETVFSSIDQTGRYAYKNQPAIIKWNLACLASCLLPLISENEKQAISLAQSAVDEFDDIYNSLWLKIFRNKLGFRKISEDDEKKFEKTTEFGCIQSFKYLNKSYEQKITDEFLEPVRLTNNFLKDGDGLICFNFRPDRARQIIKALADSTFNEFKRIRNPKLDIVTFTQYEANLPVKIAFPPESLNNFIGQIVSELSLIHISEPTRPY